MVNNYDDEEYEDSCCNGCKKNLQFYWHNDGWKVNWKRFFTTKKDCIIDTYIKSKDYYNEKIKENEKSIISYKNRISEIDTKLDVFVIQK